MSILHYQPTPNFKDTGRNVRHYVENHMDTFWDIFKPLMPYIAACLFLDLVITEHFMGINPDTEKPYEFVLFSIIANYFLICLVISWHRVIIHGADTYTAMKPFSPTKSEIGYIAMAIGLILAAMIAGAVIGAITGFISPALLVLVLPAFFIAAIFLASRLSFYFPAKATGNDISLKHAFSLSEGYVLRLLFAPIFAAWKVIIFMLAYLFVGFLILIILGTIAGSLIESGAGAVVTQFLFAAPISLFFSPLLTVIGVTVLSNFYQYALQNPRKNDDSEHYI